MTIMLEGAPAETAGRCIWCHGTERLIPVRAGSESLVCENDGECNRRCERLVR
jgi:hypothetical protein